MSNSQRRKKSEIQTSLVSSHNSNNSQPETMNMKTPLRCGVGFYAALLLGVGRVLGASEFDRNIERAFPAVCGGKLIVRADEGAIEINSSDADKGHVRALRHVRGGSQAQADELFANHDVTFKQDGNTVS